MIRQVRRRKTVFPVIYFKIHTGASQTKYFHECMYIYKFYLKSHSGQITGLTQYFTINLGSSSSLQSMAVRTVLNSPVEYVHKHMERLVMYWQSMQLVQQVM